MAYFSELALLINTISQFLDEYGAGFFSEDRLNFFQKMVQKLSEKANSDCEAFYLGLIGGSGVGKSTLINAIAGKEISSPSDRRPFTDKIVAYRHEEQDRGLAKLSDLFRDPDTVHENDKLKPVVIFDLPDIDSLESSNRNTVTQILPYLDAVIWIASPEKYADSALYSFVGMSLIHQKNFIFLLNKMDQLFDKQGADPHLKMKNVADAFAFYLKQEAELINPKLFCISSKWEFEQNYTDYFVSHEFRRLRESLASKIDSKQIRSAKRNNLIQETNNLLRLLEQYIDPQNKTRALESIQIHGKAEFHSSFCESDFEMLKESLILRSTEFLATRDRSVRPIVFVITKLLLRRKKVGAAELYDLKSIINTQTVEIAQPRLLKLERAQSEIEATILFSTGVKYYGNNTIKVDAIYTGCSNNAFEILKGRLENWVESRDGIASKIARATQCLILFLPVTLMVLKLSGLHSFSCIFRNTNWLSIPDYVLGFLLSLFSLDGLVAIVSMLIMQFLLITFLGLRRLKKIEKLAKKNSDEVVKNLVLCLNNSIKSMFEQSLLLVDKIGNGVNKFSEIVRAFAKVV